MRLRVTRHLIEGAEECDGDVCQGQVQEEVVGHSSHPCMSNISTYLSTCQHVNLSMHEIHMALTCTGAHDVAEHGVADNAQQEDHNVQEYRNSPQEGRPHILHNSHKLSVELT